MNLKVNKKLVVLLLASGMSFSLCTCAKEEMVINTDTIYFNDVISEVEENTNADEILNNTRVDFYDPITGEYIKTMSLMDASIYLEDIVYLSQKLTEMGGISVLYPDDEYYYMVEEIASQWTPDDARNFISDVYYGDDASRALAIRRLEYYKTYLDKELRVNGVNIAACLLEKSIESKVIDYYNLDYSDIDRINIYGDKIVYEDEIINFNSDEELEILDNLYNMRDNRDEFNDVLSFYDVTFILKESFNLSKSIIYKDVYMEENKIKTK